MKLNNVLRLCGAITVPDCDILGIHNDSRQIKPGYLFIAYPGAVVDGRLYCQQAIDAGAVAVAYDPDNLPESFCYSNHVVYVPVPQLAYKLAAIASCFFGDPTRALSIAGVTGTNGKTTIAYQLAQAYNELGSPAAYIGTLGQGDVHDLQPVGNTTPDALCLQQLFHQYLQQGIKHVCMEVSSHALAQQRVANIDFTLAIYTNLTHDHLDYHETMQAYAQAKALLFTMPTLTLAIINHDDAYGSLMGVNVPSSCQKLTYGLEDGADVRALNIQVTMTGSTFDVASPWGLHSVYVKALGTFNIYNSLAVFSSLLAQGYDACDVVNVMGKLNASPGRMELVGKEPCVIVDYAHTPDALDNVLSTLTQLKSGRLWVVFGCGGDRDRTKRPMMGNIASQYADVVIITSDNPRTEDPMSIIEAVAGGITGSTDVIKILDRKQAIHHALQMADKQDIILIAGKGHEAYQQIGNTRFDFSDQDVVREYVAASV